MTNSLFAVDFTRTGFHTTLILGVAVKAKMRETPTDMLRNSVAQLVWSLRLVKLVKVKKSFIFRIKFQFFKPCFIKKISCEEVVL